MENSRNTAPFLRIADAVKVTGLSAYYIRRGCQTGTIPHIMSGATYYINVPALLEALDEQSRQRAAE